MFKSVSTALKDQLIIKNACIKIKNDVLMSGLYNKEVQTSMGKMVEIENMGEKKTIPLKITKKSKITSTKDIEHIMKENAYNVNNNINTVLTLNDIGIVST